MASPAKLYDKLLIIDGSYQAHRSSHIREFRELSYNGQKTGIIFGTLRSITTIMRAYRGYFPVVCWDDGLSERRTSIYPDYKNHPDRVAQQKMDKLVEAMIEDPNSGSSIVLMDESSVDEIELARQKVSEILKNRRQFGRDYAPDSDEEDRHEYYRQRDHLVKIMRQFGIPQLLFNGFEGDDLMVLMSRVCNEGIIVSDDKDMIQMVSPSISVYRPLARETVTYDTITKEWNSTPRTYLIAKAIVGDASDSIPSVTCGLETKYCIGGVGADKLAPIIVECEEDPSRFIPMIREKKPVTANKIEGFLKRLDHFYRNMKLIDLSLVPDDEVIYRRIDTEIEMSNNHADLLTIMETMSNYGLAGVDYQGLINMTSSARANLHAGS